MSVFPTKVLFPTDGSDESELAGRAAADLAERTGSELHVAHVYNHPRVHVFPDLGISAQVAAAYREEASQLLADQVERLRSSGVNVTEAHLLKGDPVDEILELSRELHTGLIAVGGHGKGTIGRLLLGSVSEGVARHATCPVLVVRGEEDVWPPARIVVGDDGSEGARAALEAAVELAELFGARLEVVHAHPSLPCPLPDSYLNDVSLALRERVGAAGGTQEASVRATEGEPAVLILDQIEGDATDIVEEATGRRSPAMVAVGRRGLGTGRRVGLGGVSSKVLRAAHCPVLLC